MQEKKRAEFQSWRSNKRNSEDRQSFNKVFIIITIIIIHFYFYKMIIAKGNKKK